MVHEVLRLVSGVSYRLVRSAPHESLQLGDWTIPPNVRHFFHSSHHTLKPANNLTDSSQHARTPNPPLPKGLPRALVFHSRALAPHSHTSRSSRTTCAHSTRKPQIPCPALERHSTMPRAATCLRGSAYDSSLCSKNLCACGKR